jgi:hypothetical protein
MSVPTGSVSSSTLPDVLSNASADGTFMGQTSADLLGFYEESGGVAKQTVTGARSSNTALASVLTALASLGLIVDGTTAT